MKCVIVSAGYGDFLSWALPNNRRFFDRVVVVTPPQDELTISVAKACNADCVTTDAFTKNGAGFAKYDGVEQGLDHVGRSGWITIMDADILLPSCWTWDWLSEGKIYSPFRRMHPHCPPPPESEWKNVPRNSVMPNHHFLGYMQIFHAQDKVLGTPPWHGVGHRSAARGDMILMEKWSRDNRLRAPDDVLHLGEARRNWNGRITPMESIQEQPTPEPGPVDEFPVQYDNRTGFSWLYRAELDKLVELLPERGAMLEIGSASGASGSRIAELRPEARVVCIDPFNQCDSCAPMGTPTERIVHWRSNQRYNQHLWVGELDSFHRFCALKFDVILVDGDHQYTRVMSDLLYSTTILVDGGVIGAHDYGDPEWLQVTEAVDKFCKTSGFSAVDRVGSLVLLKRNQ